MTLCGQLTRKGTPCMAPVVNGRCLTHGTRSAAEMAAHCRAIATLGGKAEHTYSPEARERLRHPGPTNGAWKGDLAKKGSGRHRAQALYELRPCAVCGAEPVNKQVHRHHKDGNPLNNEPDNIAFLCVKHHAEAHHGNFEWLREDGSEPEQIEEAGIIEGTFTEL